jgi:hypothetical protein
VTVWFRFYGRLNDFLPPFRRGLRFRLALGTRWSVRDALGVVGVPHPHVNVVIVNGAAVEFTHVLEDGDRVALYPPFRSIHLGDTVRAGGRAS